jgi:hypothetical protein
MGFKGSLAPATSYTDICSVYIDSRYCTTIYNCFIKHNKGRKNRARDKQSRRKKYDGCWTFPSKSSSFRWGFNGTEKL